ncbi:MAG: DUF11 domain-containing protein [Phycisphaerales bacterium]|nr:DUF11 domain-containing protein [Phycisphaerae bacterium]NNF42508.1 DUF11 domain-containing protein [Phycisphaerales bacterium]NNM24555.1 DUF11 domain-containing protein [Phycisphaerales bacterium]
MSRQKFTSMLLVFALAGVTAWGCASQQRSVGTQQRSSASQERSSTSQERSATSQERSASSQRRSASDQQRSGTARRPSPTTRPGGTASVDGGRTAAAAPHSTPAPTGSSTRGMTRRGGWPSHMSGGGMTWSSMAYPTGSASTSALGIEKGMPSEVRVNQPFDYEIVVTNLTGETLTDVVVTDQPGDNFALNSSAPRGRVGGDGTTTWSIGSLGPHESKTIRVNGTARAEGTIGACSTATYSNMLCATVPVVAPRLRLTKTGPAEAMACDDITYRFEVANTGTGSIGNVRISDPLPAGLVSATGGRTLTFDAGTLGPGASKTFTSTVRAERTGSFQNQATASGEGGVTASSGTVTTVVRQPQLQITKSCAERQFIGRTIEYTITVTNTGDGDARDTVISDPIPSGAQFVSASDGGRNAGGSVSWNIGTLRPNASKRVTMRVSPTGAGTFRNTASARAHCAGTDGRPVTASCQTVVTGIPAILLEVVDIDDPIQVGNNETYVITVTNQGSAPDTNIRLVITLENNQSHVSNSGATRGTARGQQVVFEPLASLGPKEKATWRVVAKCNGAGDTRFAVSMTSDQLTRQVQETEATNIYE